MRSLTDFWTRTLSFFFVAGRFLSAVLPPLPSLFLCRLDARDAACLFHCRSRPGATAGALSRGQEAVEGGKPESEFALRAGE